MIRADPVCGVPVPEDSVVSLERGPERIWFCSEFCKQQFVQHPLARQVQPTPTREPIAYSLDETPPHQSGHGPLDTDGATS